MLYKVTFYGTAFTDKKRYRVEFIVNAESEDDAQLEACAMFGDLPRFHTPVWKAEDVGVIYTLTTGEVPMPEPEDKS